MENCSWISAVRLRNVCSKLAIGIVLLAPVIGTSPVHAGTYTVLYSFTGPPTDGALPYAGVMRNKAGNLFGATFNGGTGTGACAVTGCGVVFKLDTSGKETILYNFTGVGGGGAVGLIGDKAGNLYGATSSGGTYGAGVVFKLDTAGKETVLHSFTRGADGANPSAGVIRDSAGNLYGTTPYGGTKTGSCVVTGCGVVFKLDPSGNETVLFGFAGGADGGSPGSGVIRDSAGNLYGTTTYGGYGYGVVFRLDTTGKETVLYSFTGGTDGAIPSAGVIRDSAGNLYGTTGQGGIPGVCAGIQPGPCGVVFKLDPTGKQTVLHSFTGGTDGSLPGGGLIRDLAGNLYGTTSSGGTGYGVVFKLDPTGKETVLYSFTGKADGATPSRVVRDSVGNLYGTTVLGGITSGGCAIFGGCGVIFKLKP